MNESSIERISVDMNGNGYSRPNRRSVKSPGSLPMPSFLSHGQQAERIDSATKVVSSQRITARSYSVCERSPAAKASSVSSMPRENAITLNSSPISASDNSFCTALAAGR